MRRFSLISVAIFAMLVMWGCSSKNIKVEPRDSIFKSHNDTKVFAQLIKNNRGEYVIENFCSTSLSKKDCPKQSKYETDGGYVAEHGRGFVYKEKYGAYDWISLDTLTPAFDTETRFFFICDLLNKCKDEYPLLNLYYTKHTKRFKSFMVNTVRWLAIPNFILRHYGDYYFDADKYNLALDEALKQEGLEARYKEFLVWNEKAIQEKAQRDVELEAQERNRRAQQLAERERRKQEENARLKKIYDTWKYRAELPKKIGQKVCTYDNQFGYVEKIASSNIQIRRLGKVANEKEGFFFKESSKVFTYKTPENEIIWDESYKWGSCNFGTPN